MAVGVAAAKLGSCYRYCDLSKAFYQKFRKGNISQEQNRESYLVDYMLVLLLLKFEVFGYWLVWRSSVRGFQQAQV